MEIKFDVYEAENLLRNMDKYCGEMVKEMKDIVVLLNNRNPKWDDYQSKAFDNNIRDIARQLEEGLKYMSEYMRIYQEKIRELRG